MATLGEQKAKIRQGVRSINRKSIFRKALLYIGGMFLLAVGIQLSKASGTGISPVSAVPYAMELIWGIELGIASSYFFAFLILLQILILRKDFQLVQLLQFACTYILSICITITSRDSEVFGHLMAWLPDPVNYLMQIIYLGTSLVIIGIGVSLYLLPGWIPLPAEGLAKAIAQVSGGKVQFHQAKMGVDVSFVVISAALSLIFLGGFVTVREGTILAAVIIGKIVGVIMKKYKDPLCQWMEAEQTEAVAKEEQELNAGSC